MRTKKILIQCGILVSCALSYAGVAAAQSYTPLEPLPIIGTNQTATQVNFEQYVTYAFNLIIALAAAASVFMIVYGGFIYITTASSTSKSAGKEYVVNALYGLLLVLTSYLILRMIDPRLVAIPTSLVPRIERIDEAYKDAQKQTDIFSDLVADAAKYKVDLTDVRTKASAADTAAQNARDGQYDIEKQIMTLAGGNVTDVSAVANLCGNLPVDAAAQLKDLCQQRQTFIQQAMVSAGESRLITSEAKMDILNAQCAGSDEPSCFTGLMNKVKDELDSISPLLQPDQKQKLQAYGAYTQANIFINSEVADLVDKGITLDHSIDRNSTRGKNLLTVMTNLTNIVDAYAGYQGADPTTVSKMRERQQSMQKLVNNMLFGK